MPKRTHKDIIKGRGGVDARIINPCYTESDASKNAAPCDRPRRGAYMDSTPQFLDLFVDSTGELLYFLAVLAISQAALLMALGQRLRGRSEVAAGRFVVLLAGTVLAWIALMGGALYTLAADTSSDAILPPLERAVNALVIVFSGAALLAADSPRPERGMWRLTGALSIAIVIGYAITAVAWSPLA